MPPHASDAQRWLSEEVLPHEADLRAYLGSRFPTLSDQDDVVQESYVRLLRARDAGAIRNARAMLFVVARHAVCDLFRRRKVRVAVPITENVASRVVDTVPDAAEQLNQRQELEILAQAVQELPARCREVVLLRYRHGLSADAIARRLQLSPETVKVQLAKGKRRCAAYFASRGLLSAGGMPPASPTTP